MLGRVHAQGGTSSAKVRSDDVPQRPEKKKEERWNRVAVLVILCNPWSLRDWRVEVVANPQPVSRTLPMVRQEVQSRPLDEDEE